MTHPHICESCNKGFKRSSDLNRHQAQAAWCRWLIEDRQRLPPAVVPNYEELSDGEEDPLWNIDGDVSSDPLPSPDADDFVSHESLSGDNRGAVDTNPSNLPPRTHTNLHTTEQRAQMEESLDADPVVITKFPDAGRVHRRDNQTHAAYQKRATSNSNNPYYLFASKVDWEMAKWATEDGPGQAAFMRLLAIPGLIDELPELAPWQRCMVRAEGLPHEYELFFRDPMDCIKALYSNPAFVKYMMYAPEEHFADAGKTNHIFMEVMTSKWAWRVQANLPVGSTLVPVILSSDKTVLTIFTGEKTAYPVYITISNISKDLRRKPSYRAQILLGYLPTTTLDGLDLTDEDARLARQ
ncbi:hypothetical protein JAAARDRAFT_192452 [Jaapia argillacea MUCL 33604]|uniref:C2H2-type domain-containing protein n=1 Tax=Jaapia argillacea MUCL 33604 TaxID=933084 RepID=A0A067Q8F4_9AGAM|nr:hypothetical protein JAAARDRAFT_192452 [Jaapia argillacea MUCL 33604]